MHARLAELCDEATTRSHGGVNVLILSDRGIGRAARRSRRCWPSPPCTTTSCARARACRPAWCSSPASRARSTTSPRSSATAPAPSTRTCSSRPSTRSSPRAASRRRRPRRGRAQHRQGHRQGPAQDDLQDGDLDDPVLLRRADLRGRRPGEARSSTATSPAPPRASAASAWRCSRRRRSTATRAPTRPADGELLPVGGVYAWRRDGERHMWNPETIALLQHAVRDTNGDRAGASTTSTPAWSTSTPRARRRCAAC